MARTVSAPTLCVKAVKALTGGQGHCRSRSRRSKPVAFRVVEQGLLLRTAIAQTRPASSPSHRLNIRLRVCLTVATPFERTACKVKYGLPQLSGAGHRKYKAKENRRLVRRRLCDPGTIISRLPGISIISSRRARRACRGCRWRLRSTRGRLCGWWR
jgi:hypothetical protein